MTVILLLILQPNTDGLIQVEGYIRRCTWQLNRVKAIYRFNKGVSKKEKNKEYHIVGTIPKSNIKTVERDKIDTYYD